MLTPPGLAQVLEGTGAHQPSPGDDLTVDTGQWPASSDHRYEGGVSGTCGLSPSLFSSSLPAPLCLCLSFFSLLSLLSCLSRLSLYFFLSLSSLFLFFPLFLSVPEEKKGGRERWRVGREDRSAGSSPLSAFSLKSIPECVRCSFSSVDIVERSSWAGVLGPRAGNFLQRVKISMMNTDK